MAELVHISLAGRVAICPDGCGGDQTRAEAALGSRARVALAYLVSERARPVAAGTLADVVWGPALPATWRAALRGVIARVRVALSTAGLDAAAALTSGPGGYQIHLPPGSTVDVEVGRAALEAALVALASDPPSAAGAARRAVQILRGEFAGGGDSPWVERRQAELAELQVRALETLSLASSACRDLDAALWAAEEAVALEPLRESAHVRVMAAHEAAGNRAAALRAYERCRRLLADELGVTPAPDTEAAYVALLGAEPSPGGPEGAEQGAHPVPPRSPGNLPSPVTRFVGREGERASIREQLGAGRLVTLTGPGGVGKSRLALEVVGDARGDHPDGVWLVELAGLTDPRLLAEHVLSALEVPEPPGSTAADSLVAHLAPRRVLLVFDNCEHVLSACTALVHRVLRAGPHVAVVATSREPLSVEGETVWAVAPLLSHDAVALFVDRARAAAPTVDLGQALDAVAEICRRLDGLPLAIELAAARMRSMAVTDIAARLGDRFRLLADGPRTAPARHQTLRATLDWSYDSLTDAERRLFRLASVFAGDFTVEAVEALWCDDAYVTLDTVAGLVDKSLVVADRGGMRSRFRLLETMRQYGYEALVRSGGEEAARTAQLRWAAQLAETAEAGLEGPDQLAWLQLLDDELDNLRGVLDWAVLHSDAPEGPRATASLWRYWEIRGLLSEGRSRLAAALTPDVPPPLRAKLSNAAAVLAQGQGDAHAARALYGQALELRRGLGDHRGTAASLNGLGNVAVAEGDLLGARVIFEENLATSRILGDPRLIAASLMNLGVVVHLLLAGGQAEATEAAEAAERARALYLESLERYRELGDRRAVAQALENLGAIASVRGDDAAAQAYLEESLAQRRELDDRSGIAASARFLGHLALKGHEYEAARLLHEECLAIEQALGNELLVVADLASLAEIAGGEGNHAEARRLVEKGLERCEGLGDGEYAAGLRRKLRGMRSTTPA